MKYMVLNKEEAKATGVDLLKFPFFRPSHRIVNFYNPAGQVIIAEFDDWMALGKEHGYRNTHRLLGIPTDASKLTHFLPEDVKVQYDCAAWMTTEVIVIRNDGKYYIVGHRQYQNDLIQEEFTDGMELLGELSINGEFVPGFVPRHGFVIRAQRPKKDKRTDYSFDNDDGPRDREYSFQILLVNEDGTIEMPIFAQSVDNLVSILSLDDDTRYKRAYRLRHWDYPRVHLREELSMTEEQLKERSVGNIGDYHPFRSSPMRLQPQVTRGIVEVLGRDGAVAREIAVIPNLELAYVRTYG